MRQRVAAALAPVAAAGRSSKSGRPDFLAASCSRWLVLRSSPLPIAPATAAGAPERKASSMAHSACLLVPGLDQDQAGRIEAEAR